jgi:hypothetical protein
MKKSLLLLIFVLTIMNLSAQDTLTFSQTNSSMFSNKYYLYPKSKTFEHKYMTDDLQIWYGKGKYEIIKGKLHLNFGDSEKNIKEVSKISKIYDKSNFSDTLKIQFYNKSNTPSLGIINYDDKNIYSDDDGIITIPKNNFESENQQTIKTFILGSEVNIELNNLKELNTINIFAYELFINYHFESNFKRVLDFKEDELFSSDYYYTTNKRKVIFELEK